MKNKMTRTLTAAAVLLCTLSLTGCGNKAQTYTDYVQAVMDCTYRNDSAKYIELTEASAEDAQAVYDDEIEYISSLLRYNAAVEADYVNEGTITGFDGLARTLAGKVKYTVDPAVQSGDTYHITLHAEPVDFWDSAIEQLSDVYENEFSEHFYSVAADSKEYEALEQQWAIRALDVLTEAVEQTGYKEEQSIIVEITVDEDGNYGIDDKNWMDIDDLLLDMDSNAD